jgi:hypothetical protein
MTISIDTPYGLTLFRTAGEAEKAVGPQQCIIGRAGRRGQRAYNSDKKPREEGKERLICSNQQCDAE